MENQTTTNVSRNQRIIMFPLPYQGHINLMLQLANILYSKGFNITILHTKFNAPNTSNYPHFTFRSIIDNDPQDERFSNIPLHGLGSFSRIFLVNRYGGEQLRDELKFLLASAGKDEKVSCIITDAVWHFTQAVADSLNLPRLVLRTSSLFCFLIYASMPLFDDRGYFDPDNNHLKEQVVDFPLLKVKDIIKMGFRNKNNPGGELLGNMVKQTKTSSGIIWNSFKELETPELEKVLHDFPVPSFLMPFSKHITSASSSLLEQDRTFFPWLDEQPPNSVLYVSFGSVSQVEEKDFLKIANGLVDSKQSFIWVVRPGFVKGSAWLDALPNELLGEKGNIIVKWAPQQEVLAHKAIGAFWTHSGWNSTLESVCEGVPMICSPFMGDQPINAKYMSELANVGVYLENGCQREEIVSAIRRVMVDQEGEEIRERAKSLKQKLDASLIKGGSSYEQRRIFL
ncbi:UDP-glycosyltransferase 76G1-like [Rutidosis leptorrhynchoides]|uniref:UDP-glycosyltransferase 76G1-like n=1 Tax=Rutidosis leptorrhynchoides TaxID=125765 RepID=UPI003A99B731